MSLVLVVIFGSSVLVLDAKEFGDAKDHVPVTLSLKLLSRSMQDGALNRQKRRLIVSWGCGKKRFCRCRRKGLPGTTWQCTSPAAFL